MTALILPEPIAAYFAAETQVPDDVARCLERGLVANLEITV